MRRSLEQFPVIQKPNKIYGWVLEDGVLEFQWMLKNPIPEELVELISCNCKKACVSHIVVFVTHMALNAQIFVVAKMSVKTKVVKRICRMILVMMI